MKHATRVKLVVTGTGFDDRQADVREDWRGEKVRELHEELQRRRYFDGDYKDEVVLELLYICKNCGAEFTDISKIHGCAACSKEICNVCGSRSPKIGHRMWYCEEHS